MAITIRFFSMKWGRLVSIPKFRKVRRLVKWVSDNGIHERLPSDREQVFFKEYADGHLKRGNIVRYAGHVGPVPEMEHMLVGNDEALVNYARIVHNVSDRSIPEEIRDSIQTESGLLSWAKEFGRLPPHLEARIVSPKVALDYSFYIERGSYGSVRLPEEMERRVFSRASSMHVATYLERNKFLPDSFLMDCLKGSAEAVVNHMKYLRSQGKKLCDELRDSLAGNSAGLYEYAKFYGRLPEHLENTLSDPKVCLEYAVNVLRGRLPEHVESSLLLDHGTAIQYAFKVIRGFAPVRLPDVIHASIVMKSFDSNDSEIKRYMAACDSDPNKMGNK